MNRLVMRSQTILGRVRGEQPANKAGSKALGTLRFCSAKGPRFWFLIYMTFDVSGVAARLKPLFLCLSCLRSAFVFSPVSRCRPVSAPPHSSCNQNGCCLPDSVAPHVHGTARPTFLLTTCASSPAEMSAHIKCVKYKITTMSQGWDHSPVAEHWLSS